MTGNTQSNPIRNITLISARLVCPVNRPLSSVLLALNCTKFALRWKHAQLAVYPHMKAAVAYILTLPIRMLFAFWERVCASRLLMSRLELRTWMVSFLECSFVGVLLLVQSITRQATKAASVPIPFPFLLSLMKKSAALVTILIHRTYDNIDGGTPALAYAISTPNRVNIYWVKKLVS